MPYRMLVAGAAGDQNFEPGDILDLPDDYAQGWLEQGLATKTDEPATISGVEPPLTFPQPQVPEVAEAEAPAPAPLPEPEPVVAPKPKKSDPVIEPAPEEVQ